MLQAVSNEVVPSDTIHGASKEEYRRMKAWLAERVSGSKKKPSSEIVTLTPCLAHLLLGSNPNNRRLSVANANSLAADIASDRFVFNGESLIVADTGNLNDGQHRCRQVIATNKPIETVIVFGPKEATRFTVDVGKNKSAGDFLFMKGRKYSAILAASVSYHIQWRENGFISVRGHQRKPTKVQIIEAADEMHGIERSVEYTMPAMKTVKSHPVLAFCHYVFKKRTDADAADEFIGRLIDGDGVRKQSQIGYCRNRLLSFETGTRANARAELIFKCWNAWRRGETITSFQLRGGELPKVEA